MITQAGERRFRFRKITRLELEAEERAGSFPIGGINRQRIPERDDFFLLRERRGGQGAAIPSSADHDSIGGRSWQ